MQKTVLYFFLTIVSSLQAQERAIFFGKISDNLNTLENVHVQNLNTNQATNTNLQGKFKLFAKANDLLKITSIGYATKIIILRASDFGMTEKQILLKKEIIELDEIELTKHNLTGSLESDLKRTPKNIGYKKSEKASDFTMLKSKFNKFKFDKKARKEKLDMRKSTDPTEKFNILSGSIGSIDKYSQQLRATRKMIKFKEGFPAKLLSEFGSHFFFVELKIPKEKYYHFLEYCNPLGIENLYKEQKSLELIQVLEKESKSYLKLIEK